MKKWVVLLRKGEKLLVEGASVNTSGDGNWLIVSGDHHNAVFNREEIVGVYDQAKSEKLGATCRGEV